MKRQHGFHCGVFCDTNHQFNGNCRKIDRNIWQINQYREREREREREHMTAVVDATLV